MKLRVAIGALIAVSVMASAAWAESARVGQLVQAQTGTFETTYVNPAPGVSLVSGFGNGSIIYGFSVYPTAANGYCALYDTATSTVSPATTQGVFIDEGGDATALDPWMSSWPAPYKLQNGLLVECIGARATIFHDVK